ncbi:MAG TPA: redoxin domain-containing protein, partial [Solirubrobacteraceae bacterium]|nr:redoxin domain-containing protein [Solirubrobacteraceae bacterium]
MALAAALAAPEAALAHGLSARQDLPIPEWLLAWGAAAVLVASFVALAALWPRPRLERARARDVARFPLVLEVALGALGEPRRVLLDPRLRHIRTFSAMAKGPQPGERAPDFELPGTEGTFKLSDHLGERVVLLFYPGDETPVCTKQFCS